LVPPESDFATDLRFSTHPDLRQSPRVRAFMDFATSELAKEKRLVEGSAVDAFSG
jgi:hypothetical protein